MSVTVAVILGIVALAAGGLIGWLIGSRGGEQAKATPFLAAHGLPSDSFFQLCHIAHMTHAGLRAPPVTVERAA